MIKHTKFALVDPMSEEVLISKIDTNSLEKSAGVEVLNTELITFLKKLDPVKGKSYLLTNAMGASDYFSSNLNADWFSEKILQDYHKTFELYGHQYRHHVNKDPKIAEGKVVFSYYNQEMHRVELIVEVDNDKVQDILSRLEEGKTVATSMACKVSHDICSICGNKSKKREDYCIHLKHFKNKIHTPTSPIPGATFYGQKAYAINPDPRFFDISFVTIPADSTSSVLMKVAESLGKESTIIKEVVEPLNLIEKINPELVRKSHKCLPKKTLMKLAKYDTDDVMASMIDMNMFPTFSDYVFMKLASSGESDVADKIYGRNLVIDIDTITSDDSVITKYAHSKADGNIMDILSEHGEEIGIGEPLVMARISDTDFTKIAGEEHVNSMPFFVGAGGGYYGYNKLLDTLRKNKVVQSVAQTKIPPAAKRRAATVLMNNPLMFATGLIGAGLVTNELQRKLVKQSSLKDTSKWSKYIKDVMRKGDFKSGPGQFLAATAVVAPLSFLYSSKNRKDMLEGKEVSYIGEQFAKNPTSSAALAVAGTYLPKSIFNRFQGHKGTFAKGAEYLPALYLYDREEYEKTAELILAIDSKDKKV